MVALWLKQNWSRDDFFVDVKISDVELAPHEFHPQAAQVHDAVHILSRFVQI